GACTSAVSACGAGTVLVSGVCVATDAAVDAPPVDASHVSCGPGTYQIGEECLPNTSMPGFDIRVAHDPIVADGYEKVGVLALGPVVDAGASGLSIELSIVPPNAGTIDQPLLTLGPSGAATLITPCNAVLDPTCIEPFQIVMTPAGDQQTVLGTSPL